MSDSSGNRLIDSLPARPQQALLAVSEEVELEFGQGIWAPGKPVLHVYFPITSFVSELFPVDDHENLELTLVGSEGMIGLPLVLGVDTTIMQALVQGAGTSLRVNAGDFLEQLEALPALRRQLHRYVYFAMTQLALTSACNSFHDLSARLARWLLLTHDRGHRRSFRLTHQFLAQMLGVRRVGITNAAGEFQKQGLIRYGRGVITVIDLAGLEAVACGCYRSAKNTYARVLG